MLSGVEVTSHGDLYLSHFHAFLITLPWGARVPRSLAMKVSFGVGLSSGDTLPRQENAQKFMDLVKMVDDFGVLN